MDNIRYSVIIPHYKSLDLLVKCIGSIPLREDIQVIVVDDNSGIPEEYFTKEECFRRNNIELVFSKVGGSAGRARNDGLKLAKGKWLIFADADDFFLDGAFDLCDRYSDSSYDIVYFGIKSVNSKTNEIVDRYNVYDRYVQACDNSTTDLIDNLRFHHDVPWGKMIRHKLVIDNNIRFGETRYCNDTLFSTLTALKASSVYAEKACMYCVTFTDGSLTTQHSPEANMIRFEVMLQKNCLLRDNGYGKYRYSTLQYLNIARRFGLRYLFRAIRMADYYEAEYFRDLIRYIIGQKEKYQNR